MSQPFLRNAAISSLFLIVWKIPLLAQQPKSTGTADAIYLHGDIITGEGLTSLMPQRDGARHSEWNRHCGWK
ncbi:MAG: hypothetical protein WDN23_04525 [Edaphobacter sp.]